MLADLTALIAGEGQDDPDDAVLHRNVLGKPSVRARQAALYRLRQLYGLDDPAPICRALMVLWAREPARAPLCLHSCVPARAIHRCAMVRQRCLTRCPVRRFDGRPSLRHLKVETPAVLAPKWPNPLPKTLRLHGPKRDFSRERHESSASAPIRTSHHLLHQRRTRHRNQDLELVRKVGLNEDVIRGAWTDAREKKALFISPTPTVEPPSSDFRRRITGNCDPFGVNPSGIIIPKPEPVEVAEPLLAEAPTEAKVNLPAIIPLHRLQYGPRLF